MVSPLYTARALRLSDEPTGHATRQTLTVEEAAEVLGIGRTLAFEMAWSGDLPTLRLGRRLLVLRPAPMRMLGIERVVSDHPIDDH